VPVGCSWTSAKPLKRGRGVRDCRVPVLEGAREVLEKEPGMSRASSGATVGICFVIRRDELSRGIDVAAGASAERVARLSSRG
jgi:hypothetical protein